jgi:hypothetical protein
MRTNVHFFIRNQAAFGYWDRIDLIPDLHGGFYIYHSSDNVIKHIHRSIFFKKIQVKHFFY